jgi:heavy metal sensor kinase
MSRWFRPSFRLRLTLWNVATMVVILAVYAGTVYALVSRNVSEALNDRLYADLEWPREMLDRLPDGSIGTYDEAADTDASPWLQVWDNEGNVVYSTFNARRFPVPNAAELAGDARDQIRVVDAVEPPLRVLSGETSIGGDPFVIQVARSEESMRRDRAELLILLALGLPLGVALAGLGGYTLARRALHPVDNMAERARLITAERLTDRLPVDDPHDEFGKLATVFNETLTSLELSFAQMKRFTSDASHELRTPLTAMRSVGEVGLRGRRSETEYREVISSMLEEVDRLSQLVEHLLAMSRADAGELRLSREEIVLGGVAEEVASQLGVLAEEKGQSIKVDSAETLTWVGDRTLLGQALMNLVDNAVKHTPESGKVTLRVFPSSGGAVIDVEDTGPGIPREYRERVFDRFYRVDASRSRAISGMGLGLSIARWAVEANGGTLDLERSDSNGSVFRIFLPGAGVAASPAEVVS